MTQTILDIFGRWDGTQKVINIRGLYEDEIDLTGFTRSHDNPKICFKNLEAVSIVIYLE